MGVRHWIELVVMGMLALGGSASPIFGFGADKGETLQDYVLFGTFKLMEQFAAAAYCNNNHNSVGDKIACASGNCQLIEDAETLTLAEFEDFPGTDVTGYVAVDNTNKLVVVSFRGSNSIENWATNLDFPPMDTDLCDGCTAHSGFWKSWVDARPDVMAAVQNASASYPEYQLVATGHSLGGAIASLAAAQLRNEGSTVALYTFGSPRIAPETLSNYISNQPGGNFRITHYNDLVPRLPPRFLEYVHISPEYYIDKKNGEDAAVSDIRILEGSVNKGGNNAWIATDIGAHLWYFNSITACAIDQALSLDFDKSV